MEYLFSTFGILNPALIILLFVSLKNKSCFSEENKFLIRTFFGFLIFFFFYSFRSRVEAHWVAFSAIPLSILIYNISISNNNFKQLKYIGIVGIVLLFSARILIVLDISLETEFHRQKKGYFMAISALANGKKVVFVNSYQKASKYFFFTGEESSSDNNVYYRKIQYDLLNSEELFNNKQVLFIGNQPSSFFDSLQLKSKELILYKVIDNYPVFNKLKATINNNNSKILNKKGKMDLTIYNPYSYTIDLQQKELPYRIKFCLTKDNKRIFIPLKINNVKKLKPDMNNIITVQWDFNNILQGKYKLQIVMSAGYLYPKVISKKYNVEIKKNIA